jgi:hypothetical protein
MISFGAHRFAEEQFCSRKRSLPIPLVVAAGINSIFQTRLVFKKQSRRDFAANLPMGVTLFS